MTDEQHTSSTNVAMFCQRCGGFPESMHNETWLMYCASCNDKSVKGHGATLDDAILDWNGNVVKSHIERARSCPRTKLYALYTSAPFEIARDTTIAIAKQHGHVAELTELPDGVRMIAPRRPLGAARWAATFLILAAAPFALHYLTRNSNRPAAAIQGFGLGWICAALILSARRFGYRFISRHR